MNKSLRKAVIAGNWKMNKTPAEAAALINEMKPLVADADCDVVLCVPYVDIPAALEAASRLPKLRVRGLMAIPPICAAPEENRPFFLRMKQLFIDNGEKKYDNVSMDFLSMGMSGDYTEAIACGANLIRVGSGIFGPRHYPSP